MAMIAYLQVGMSYRSFGLDETNVARRRQLS